MTLIQKSKEPGFPVTNPPGLRSCLQGGKWVDCPHPNKKSDLHTIEMMIGNRHQFLLVQRSLQQMLIAAEQGTLVYGKSGDVYEMRIQPAILELRLQRTVQYPDELIKFGSTLVKDSFLRIKEYLGLK